MAAHENESVTDLAGEIHSYCGLPYIVEREISPDVAPVRTSLIRMIETKWVNGTVLHYYFFTNDADGEEVRTPDGGTKWVSWVGEEAQREVVQEAFKIWKAVGLGLEFKEVDNREDAEIRIGFMKGDGAWSYVGRAVLDQGMNERTMNFGWDLTKDEDGIDTAIHEIGHTLGFPHEHQNPHAGIVWNEEAVYAALAGHPNYWPPEKTYYNIIRKIVPDDIQGSNWDKDSIMHYPFRPGLIIEPTQFANGLSPAPGLSERDKSWVTEFYPPLDGEAEALQAFRSVAMQLEPRGQKNFVFEPLFTRYYNIRTFGKSDTVMVLFEDVNGEPRYVTADDDSGRDENASLRLKLFKGSKYILRIRLYWQNRGGETALMIW